MSLSKKFKIRNLKKKTKFQNAAQVVLDYKLERTFKEIDKFLKNDSVKNLHSLRIAFRRFRYSMEIFCGCYEEKFFNNVYRHSQKLQDMLGEARDLDVWEMKLRSSQKESNNKIPEAFYESIEKEKIQLRRDIKMELIKFRSDKGVNFFFISKKDKEK